MKIREMVERLQEVASRLPDGLDSDVRVHLCNGSGTEGVITLKVEVATRRLQNERTSEVVEAHALVSGHPHLDDGVTVARPMTMDLDGELAQLTGDGAPPESIPPGTKSITVDMGDGKGFRIPVGPDGVPETPGSPAAAAGGCTCDAEKNNHGRGIEVEDRTSVYFIMKIDCPLHPQVDPSRNVWIIE